MPPSIPPEPDGRAVSPMRVTYKGVPHGEIDKLLRLPNFEFPPKRVLGRKFKFLGHALGAISEVNGNEHCLSDDASLITKNLTIIFESAIDVHERNPSMEEACLDDTYWEMVLKEIRARDENLASRISIKPGAVQHIIMAYRHAYHRAKIDRLADKVEGMSMFEIQTERLSPSGDPNKRLVAAVSTWYHGMEDSPYSLENNPALDAETLPFQYDDVSDKDYIPLIESLMEERNHVIIRMAEKQKLCEERNRQREEKRDKEHQEQLEKKDEEIQALKDKIIRELERVRDWVEKA